jgi:hypothetical protein
MDHMDGIEIPRDVAEEEQVPEDLDSSRVGPYRFPDTRRRRNAAIAYLVLAVLVTVLVPNSPGRWVAVALAAALAGWHWLAAWPRRVEPEEALAKAAMDAPFAIGHASAALTFHGWRSRPRWHVVVYESGEPPAQRALIVLDAVTGERVAEPYVEDIETV